MQAEFKFNNGDKVKERLVGVVGIIASRSDHLFGCNRYWVQPQETKDGKPVDGMWHDEDALELVEAAVVVPKRYRVYESDGVTQETPIRRAGGPSSQPPSHTGPTTR